MYKEVFKFSSRPFTSAPYVKHYFASESMNQTLTQTRNCIDRSAGPVVVVGGPGTGKSLLLGMLEDQYQSQFSVANLSCVRLDNREDLLKSILFTLNQPHQGMSEGDLRFALIDYLKPSDRCPNGVVLLIDDAHTLEFGLLDEIRLITNFVRDGQARVRLVLAGTQMLEENLTATKLQSLNQRIAARCYLTSMRREETGRYVVDHVERVGGNGAELFDQESLKTIHEVSDGCPRLVNQVSEHALIVAATRGNSQITEQHVREAWDNVQGIPGDWSAPANSQQDTSAIQKDDSWTVIEFGQLDDSDESEQTGTVYDFENSEGEASSVDQAPAKEPSPAPFATGPVGVEPVAAAAAFATGIAASNSLENEPTFGELTDQEPEPQETEASVNESVADPLPAEPSIESGEQQPRNESEEDPNQLSDSHEVEASESVQLRTPVETVDPFAETFAEEEQLLDRFAPVIAHQNHASLDVTSEDLEAIRQVDDHHERATPALSLAALDTAEQPQLQIPSEDNQAEPSPQQRHSSPTVQVIGLDDGGSGEVLSLSDNSSTDNLDLPTPSSPPEVERVLESKDEPVAPAPEASDSESQDRDPNRDVVTENAGEIEREAEAILERLRLSTVSHETSDASTTATKQETEKVALAAVQTRELDESQKVLQEILSQKNLLAAARGEESPNAPPSEQSGSSQAQSINIEYPLGQTDSSPEPRRDDSEMLIVSRMEQKMESPKSNQPEPIPFPETPVSKGRAQRMDYQQLFDQLRDISNEQV